MSTRPNARRDRVAQGLDRRPIPDVRGRHNSRAHFGAYFFHLRAAASGGNDMRAVVGETDGDGAAQTGGGADDDCDAPGKIEKIWHSV